MSRSFSVFRGRVVTNKHEFKFRKKINNNPATRLPRENGKWKGEPGNGEWFSSKPEVTAITNGKPVVFENGRPDFSPWQVGKPMKFKKGMLKGDDGDFKLVHRKLAEAKGLKNPTAAKKYLNDAGLTPHHLDDKTIQFIPTKLHKIPHVGSASDMRGGY